MSYARRPMGDYKTYGYAGDPGWLSSLWGGIKKIAPAIIGGLVGGPVGAALGGAVGSANGKPSRQLTVPGTVGGAISFPGGTSIGLGFQGGAKNVMIPGQGPLPPFAPGGAGQAGRGGVLMPSGYHYAKDGSGRLVRNRRMNVANPKALRRAMRRASGFEKLARRSINFNKRVRPARKRSS
jgi:hypothetical protein